MAETNVNDFLRENVGSPVKTEKVKFKRFKAPFEIKTLTGDDLTELRKQAMRRTVDRRTHQVTEQMDENKFEDLVVVSSVVVPNLYDAKLQKSWQALGDPAKVLGRMLTSGEYNELTTRIMDVSGLNEDPNDLVEEAKN